MCSLRRKWVSTSVWQLQPCESPPSTHFIIWTYLIMFADFSDIVHFSCHHGYCMEVSSLCKPFLLLSHTLRNGTVPFINSSKYKQNSCPAMKFVCLYGHTNSSWLTARHVGTNQTFTTQCTVSADAPRVFRILSISTLTTGITTYLQWGFNIHNVDRGIPIPQYSLSIVTSFTVATREILSWPGSSDLIASTLQVTSVTLLHGCTKEFHTMELAHYGNGT